MYEETFGTDWETIDDRDEIVLRAYALGVAARLGEEHPGELERLAEQTGTTYDRSFVDLAYQKGRDEAAAAAGDDADIWEDLVEERTEIDPLERTEDIEWDDPTAGTSLPDALGPVDIGTLPDDSTERVRRPSFLDRERSGHPAAGDDDRTVFGRKVSDVDRTQSDRDDADDGDGGPANEPTGPDGSQDSPPEPDPDRRGDRNTARDDRSTARDDRGEPDRNGSGDDGDE